MGTYRPPGRSNRSGRSQADNDVFEGLPVKQWGQQFSRVSLAPPVSEVQNGIDDKWSDPPMPRDSNMLSQWTQHLLRLARSGKVGTKRKQESSETQDEDGRPEGEEGEDGKSTGANAGVGVEDRGYVAKKWKPVPEHMLVQEHKHFEFLAKRRRGMPSLYAPDSQGANVPMRKTKVQKADASGEAVIYEVLVPEGQHVDGEVLDTTELADVKPAIAAPGTVIEGVGIANEEGVLVAEHLKPQIATRQRNRPPPKKKGGPGRGKKRVTFTNPDGSTYTTIVPNATKIVPQPGQIVKHVAKGEEASADVTAEEAAAANASRQTGEEDEGEEGSDDGDEDGDDDDDREEGEVSDEDAPGTGAATPAKPTPAPASEPMEDVKPTIATEDLTHVEEPAPAAGETIAATAEEDAAEIEPESAKEEVVEPPPQPTTLAVPEDTRARDPSSSPEMPLAGRKESLPEPSAVTLAAETETKPAEEIPTAEAEAEHAAIATAPEEPEKIEIEKEPASAVTDDGDLLGNLEKHLSGEEKEKADGKEEA